MSESQQPKPAGKTRRVSVGSRRANQAGAVTVGGAVAYVALSWLQQKGVVDASDPAAATVVVGGIAAVVNEGWSRLVTRF